MLDQRMCPPDNGCAGPPVFDCTDNCPASMEPDVVNHPAHYTSDPSGIECIQITRWRNFNVGNAIKYLWRAGLKESVTATDGQIEDLEKAVFYIKDEINRLKGLK